MHNNWYGDSKNINGLVLDKLVLQKIDKIPVHNSLIYQELSKLPFIKGKINIDEELKKRLKNNTETIKNLVDKLKYMDIEVVDIINKELKMLKQENEQIERKLTLKQNIQIDDFLMTFDNLELKVRKNIVRMLIKDMRGEGNNIDIKLANKLSTEQRGNFINCNNTWSFKWFSTYWWRKNQNGENV